MSTLSDDYGTGSAPSHEDRDSTDDIVDELIESIDESVDQTVSDEQREEQEAHSQEVIDHLEHQTKRRLIVGVVTVLVLVIIAFFTIYKVISYRQDLHSAAMATCSANYSTVEDSTAALRTAMANARKKTAYSSGDVADPNTLNDLQEAITQASSMPPLPTCDEGDSATSLLDTADLLNVYNDDVINATNALNYATKAAEASHLELENMHR